MKQQRFDKKALSRAVALGALATLGGPAGAVQYDLCAGVTTSTMPDGTEVTLWGFGPDTGGPCSPSVPGPWLTVPPGDSDLTLNLRNELPDPVSIVISGQQAVLQPVFFSDADGRQRVRSFTHETAPGASDSYSWSNLKPGTFLYSSGTHPAVQVQMGLYGGMTRDAAPGQAYPGVDYDNEVMLLYSEIDPALHGAVADGNYGTAAYPSTVNYAPRYFLVNGDPVEAGSVPSLAAGASGERTLLRLLNAGLQDHALVLQGEDLSIVAEDGNPYPWPRHQYSVLMAAGKSKDAMLEASASGSYVIHDRRLRLSNGVGISGGLTSFLTVSAPASGPTANDDAMVTQEDAPEALFPVLANDTPALDPIDPATVSIDAQAVYGLAVAKADGTVGYTPDADFSGTDGFTYSVRDTAGNPSNVAAVTVEVSAVNDAPVALDDSAVVVQDSSDNPIDVRANDTDVDGDGLTITSVGVADNGGVATTDGSTVSYTPAAGFSGTETFGYGIGDGNGGTASATVTVVVEPVTNQAPLAVDDYATVQRNTGASSNAVTPNLVANDSDADGAVDPTSVVLLAQPRSGTVVNNGDGTVTYTPNPGKRGSDAFSYQVSDDLGAVSNEATVRIDILK